jgi:hypothetical protein
VNVLGIDPGLEGAIVDEHHVVFVDDPPVHQIRAGKKGGTRSRRAPRAADLMRSITSLSSR